MSTKEATPAQVSECRRILGLKQKGHYAVLGVDRRADASALKKAYRKLAIAMHPDKNSAPQASEAFKVVSGAYACLSDEGKRRVYDMTGQDSDAGVDTTGGRGNGGFQRGRYAGRPEEMSPEDLLNMFFFGGAGGGAAQRRQQQQRQQHQQARQQERPASSMQQLMQLVPMLLFFLLTFGSFGDDPPYALNRSAAYKNPQKTGSHGCGSLVGGIQFYARDDYHSKYPRNSPQRCELERRAERSYHDALNYKCGEEKNQRQQLIWAAQRMTKRDRRRQMYLDRANKELESCVRYAEVFNSERTADGRRRADPYDF